MDLITLRRHIKNIPVIGNISRKVYYLCSSYFQDKKRNKIFKKNSSYVFKKLSKILNENDVEYWLEFGTLLGAIRDKGFISFDNDIDLGVRNIDKKKLEKILTEEGFVRTFDVSVAGIYTGGEQTYYCNGVSIDFFDFGENNEKSWCYCFSSFSGLTWKESIRLKGGLKPFRFDFVKFGIIPLDFLGFKVFVPSNFDEHLREIYGDKYMIPDPNFKHGFNKTEILDKVGHVTLFEK